MLHVISSAHVDGTSDSAAIKVKWNTKLADYSQEQIKSIFSAYGPVQHVAARPEKGRAAVLYEDTMDAVRFQKSAFRMFGC
jgi:hypothetical protein